METKVTGRAVVLDRAKALANVREGGVWDVVIIGGGATGLGAAVDAASRGLRTLLLEGDDFAKGTSSRSTKLIHGGVRYLKQGRLLMVMKALRERDRLLANAPHLVTLRQFIVPCRNYAEIAFYAAGLKLYDLLASGRGLPSSRILGRKAVIREQEGVNHTRLAGGIQYSDGQFDDARLALALAQTCVREGGTVINYCKVNTFSRDMQMMNLRVTDRESGEDFNVMARSVVNATGVFADAVREMDGDRGERLIRASQGVHLVLPLSFLPGKAAIMVPKTDDGRVLFCIPWKGHALLGTTDTPVESIDTEPQALEEEIAFLIGHAGKYLSKAPSRSDVLSVFVGLRPLIGDSEGPTKSLSREHVIHESESGLITITGGKWTTYRHMAEHVVDRVCRKIGAPDRTCVTRNLPLYGCSDDTDQRAKYSEYGADRHAVLATMREEEHGEDPLHPDLPYVMGQVTWAMQNEMARTVEDVLARRTRALFLNAAASNEMAPRVARKMADYLNKDETWVNHQIGSFAALASQYQLPS
ncbi:MAG: glycerol-3-phosphate dehydrogenase/oxidase [Rhodothermales bacterium]